MKNNINTTNGRRTMIWITPDQQRIIEELKTLEPGVSMSQQIRNALTLHLRVVKHKLNDSRKH